MIDGYKLRQAMANFARQVGKAFEQIRFVMTEAANYRRAKDRLEKVNEYLKYTKHSVRRKKAAAGTETAAGPGRSGRR